jgi:hypothetical protein
MSDRIRKDYPEPFPHPNASFIGVDRFHDDPNLRHLELLLRLMRNKKRSARQLAASSPSERTKRTPAPAEIRNPVGAYKRLTVRHGFGPEAVKEWWL